MTHSPHQDYPAQEPSKVQWVAVGILYLVVVILSNHPRMVGIFPHGSTQSLLVMLPMVGVAYMLRDGIQYLFEDTQKKRVTNSGFWPSMIFVGLGVMFTLIYADPQAKTAGTVAYAVASVVDGIIFSALRHRSFSHRLLLSNIAGASMDCWIFMVLMNKTGYMNNDFYDMLTSTFLQISPALIIFLFNGTVLSCVLGMLAIDLLFVRWYPMLMGVYTRLSPPFLVYVSVAFLVSPSILFAHPLCSKHLLEHVTMGLLCV